jgi:hypothetical protein
MSTPVTIKPKALLLAPMFLALVACGGASDPSPAETAAVMADASRPADYSLDPAVALIGDNPLSADVSAEPAGIPQDSAAAGAPADQFLAMAAAPSPASSADTKTGGRDPLKQPFASNSIWNMPIGSKAVYVPANLSGNPGKNKWATMPLIDDELIIMKPSAPMTDIYFSNAAWTGRNRCPATGGKMLQVPMPSDYVVPNNRGNNGTSILMPDGHTIIQAQPLARCKAGGYATSLAKFAAVDLYGPGVTGAHGGSGLSAIGGSIRLGELRPGSTTGPRHVLKIDVYAAEALFNCSKRSYCFRWPAVTADSYAVGHYGSANGNQNAAMKMGALLAIPASRSLASLNLETEPAKQLAWTLQNYGGYIVDDTYAAGFGLSAEDGPDGSVRKQFKADWGFEMLQKVVSQGKSPWVRDMQKLAQALHVVDNNGPNSIGGGGTPLQPLAPSLTTKVQ